MVSKPSRTWGSIIKRYFHTLLNLLFFYFMFYSLVYVQCDSTSSRTCPLPFDPQTAIQTTYEKTSTFIETTYHNTLPLIGNGIQYAHTTKDHIWDYCNPYYKTKIKPVWDTTILPKLLIIQQTSLYRNLKLAIFDPLFIPYLKIYEISESKILETQTDADYMKGRELQLEFLNTCHEYSSRLGLFWHTQAVYFIDQVVPFIMYYVHLGIRIFVSSVNTTCRWIRKEWMGNTTILLQVRDRIIRYVYTHPLYEVVAGRVAVFGQTQIGKDLALVGGLVRPYLEMGGVMVVHIVDEVWKFLEGRPSLVPKVWETLCVLLYQFFNRYF
ncbi:hypothetical protein BC833DRAFT_606381 [Globomyces pollinis-pini]|nr:hypothetical protein BC833DRAFT_606381 [Globomyces pollinis-pini]